MCGRSSIHLQKIFFLRSIEAEDDRQEYGEVRFRALGHVGEAYYLVVYTWRGEHRRLISAWKVGDHGKRRYQAILTQGTACEA